MMENKRKWLWNTKQNGWLRAIIIVVALFFDFGLRFLPAPGGMSQDAFGVIGVFAGSLLLWLTISIDWPSILCILALALIPGFGFTNALTSSFGSETFVFLMFTFVCTYALSKTPIIKRIAVWFVSTKLAKKSGWMFVTMFFLSVTLVGMFMSPTVLFVVMIPILEQIFEISGIQKGEKVGKLLYIGLAFCISISSGMTPIAHVFPILAMKTAGLTIDYFKYMASAVPTGLVAIALMILMFKLFLKPDVSKLRGVDVTSLKNELPQVSAKEILTLSIFLLVIFLWIVPSICIDNIILTIILFVICALLFLFYGINLTKKGKNIGNKSDFVLGISYIVLTAITLLTSLILLITNTINLFEILNFTKIGFLILFVITLLPFSLRFLINSIKNRKNIAISSILLTINLLVIVLTIIFPSTTKQILTFISDCKTAMPPMLGTVLLCIIQVKNEPLISIGDAFKNGIPWASLMMCAGTLTLGAALTNNAIGLKAFLESNLTNALGGASSIILLIVFVVWALIQTNLSSNMVTATLVSTVANTLLLGISTSLNLPAVIAIIGMLSAFAFATPPSMPHIAITASSGYANTKDMLKYGGLMMAISFVCALIVAYPIGMLIL